MRTATDRNSENGSLSEKLGNKKRNLFEVVWFCSMLICIKWFTIKILNGKIISDRRVNVTLSCNNN